MHMWQVNGVKICQNSYIEKSLKSIGLRHSKPVVQSTVKQMFMGIFSEEGGTMEANEFDFLKCGHYSLPEILDAEMQKLFSLC